MAREIIYTVNVEITGITPLLMHKCSIFSLGNGEGGKPSEKDYSMEWKDTVYVAMGGDYLIVPALIIEAALREAGKGFKVGRSNLGRIVPPNIALHEMEYPVLVNGKKVTVADIAENEWLLACPVVIGNSRITRIRAMLPPGWKVSFTMDVFSNRLKKNTMRDIIETAGYAAGLMDWRPGAKKPGKFGQFELTKYEEVS